MKQTFEIEHSFSFRIKPVDIEVLVSGLIMGCVISVTEITEPDIDKCTKCKFSTLSGSGIYPCSACLNNSGNRQDNFTPMPDVKAKKI